MWTPEKDYALRFGAALGMSASQIAGSLNDGTTRNAVIGRCHRHDVQLSGVRPRGLDNAKQKQPPSKPKTRIPWTLEQDALVINGTLAGKNAKAIAEETGHTESAIHARRFELNMPALRRFNEVEDDIIRADYAAFVAVQDTAAKLNRSPGTLRQRHRKLGLRERDGRKTRLANRFGLGVLSISDDPAEVRRVLREGEEAKQAAQKAAFAAKVANALADMRTALDCGEDRIIAFRAAMLAGATLEQVGQEAGITRERVRQIVHNVRPPARPDKTFECQSCHAHHPAPKRGRRKYCDECRLLIDAERAEANREQNREYQARYRVEHRDKWLESKRRSMRRSRARERLTSLGTDDAVEVIRQFADILESRTRQT